MFGVKIRFWSNSTHAYSKRPAVQTLQKEIQGHQPRCDDIFERSQSILKADSPNVESIRARLADLQQLWSLIIQETEKRHTRLEEAHKAQQYYFDAAEAEAWMSEQELYMMSEEKAKVCARVTSQTIVRFDISYTHFCCLVVVLRMSRVQWPC